MAEAFLPVPSPRVRITGHYGEFFQGRLGAEGPLGLVTLPCPEIAATAMRTEAPFEIVGSPVPFGAEEVPTLFRALGLPRAGRFALEADVPFGIGAGMSTAALVAIARGAGTAAEPATLARACLAVEGATDPVMFGAPQGLLWSPRSAEVLETLPPPPAFDVVGGTFGPPEPTDPGDMRFPDIEDLLHHWRSAVARQDRAAVAGIATESTRRTTALRGPSDDPAEALAREVGALGVARAHTGSARAFLFAPSAVPADAAAAFAEGGLADIIAFRTP